MCNNKLCNNGCSLATSGMLWEMHGHGDWPGPVQAEQAHLAANSITVNAVHQTQPNSARHLCLLQPCREPGPAAHAHRGHSHTPVLLAPTLLVQSVSMVAAGVCMPRRVSKSRAMPSRAGCRPRCPRAPLAAQPRPIAAATATAQPTCMFLGMGLHAQQRDG